MIPIRSQSRPGSIPFGVWILAILCSAVLIRLALLPDDRAGRIVNSLAVVPSRIAENPAAPTQLATLVTASLLHASWLHLVLNALYLLIFGPMVESRLGRTRFIALFFAAGACGALAHVAADPGSSMPLVGASGAIAGVLGAHLVLEPHGEIVTLVPVIVFVEVAVLPAGFLIGVWVALQLAAVLAPASQDAAPIAWYAHLGGFVIGALFALATVARERAGTQS